jgi:dTDP-glucose 4,6-dehydratase
MSLLITGGAGFIGSHVVRHFVIRYPTYHIINLDALTYAGNLENLKDIEKAPNYRFVKGSIEDSGLLDQLFSTHDIKGVIHLAAESHVDRSISDPMAFIRTNINGTAALLNACRKHWKSFEGKRFYQISTDEVFGALGATGFFTEESPYAPNSPYSASKASADHLVRAYGETYGLPYVISNCSNNYGPNHFPEKLIPLCIHNILQDKPLPIYGDGQFTRDWLFVTDHALAIDHVYHRGKNAETYLVGGHNEYTNIDLIRLLCDQMDQRLKRPQGTAQKGITFVKDRPGHDKRYAIDASKIERELGWIPAHSFEQGLAATINWYLENNSWLEQVTTGAYQSYYKDQYKS